MPERQRLGAALLLAATLALLTAQSARGGAAARAKCSAHAAACTLHGLSPNRALSAGDKATAYIKVGSTTSDSYDVEGGRYKRYTVDTCKGKCDTTMGCAGFTFAASDNGDTNVCTLKTWIPIVGLTAASGVDTHVGRSLCTASPGNQSSAHMQSHPPPPLPPRPATFPS